MTIHTAARLTRPRGLLLAVGVTYLLAWCLPSVVYDVMGTVVMRGWDVTWEALTPFLKAGMEMNALLMGLTSIASALTNVVFILGFIHAWRRTSPARLSGMASDEPRPFRWTVWALSSSATLNLFWLVLFRRDLGLLREGYYLWVVSFVALGVVLVWVRRGAIGAAGVWLPTLLAFSVVFAAYSANFAGKDLRLDDTLDVDTAGLYAAPAMPASVPDLGADTILTTVAVSHDKEWRELDGPFIARFSSKYRNAMWLCSRTTLRVAFWTISVKSDLPVQDRQTAWVRYQFAPGPTDSALFRMRGVNWLERDLTTLDVGSLLRTREVRVWYRARGASPPNGVWRLVVPDSGRARLAAWADSCQTVRK